MIDHSEDAPIRGPRFSLLTLLVFMTFVALAVGLGSVARNNRQLWLANESLVKENRRLRDEAGELFIEDETELHAIQISTDTYFEWQWRIWIPEGGEYLLCYEGGEIPEDGFSDVGGTIFLRSAGEQLIRYSIRRDPRDDRWYGSLSAGGGSRGKDEQPWVEWKSQSSRTSGVSTATRSYPKNQIVELVRHRVSKENSTDNIEDPANGFMIWLEPIK